MSGGGTGDDRPPSWESPTRVLTRHGLSAKRAFSQNFLVSKPTVERIAAAVAPAAGETVVELGPGLGTLTAALLRAGAHVVAVERDRDMLAVLEAEMGSAADLELVAGDAAEIDLRAIAARAGGSVAVAGNLPYSVTGAILRNLVGQREAISRAVVMVQREVRDRLRAEPSTKSYGALTVFTQAAFRVEPVMTVRPGAFHPAPKVSSAVVRLIPHEAPRARETDAFRQVVRGAFETRRKTIRNALLRVAGGDAERVDRALAEVGIDGRRRGETLSVEELDALARAW